MKNAKEVIIIHDRTYGFGPAFRLTKAILSEKTLEVDRIKHRRKGQIFAIATKELATEAAELEEMRRAFEKRAQQFREKLRALMPKQGETP